MSVRHLLPRCTRSCSDAKLRSRRPERLSVSSRLRESLKIMLSVARPVALPRGFRFSPELKHAKTTSPPVLGESQKESRANMQKVNSMVGFPMIG